MTDNGVNRLPYLGVIPFRFPLAGGFHQVFLRDLLSFGSLSDKSITWLLSRSTRLYEVIAIIRDYIVREYQWIILKMI